MHTWGSMHESLFATQPKLAGTVSLGVNACGTTSEMESAVQSYIKTTIINEEPVVDKIDIEVSSPR